MVGKHEIEDLIRDYITNHLEVGVFIREDMYSKDIVVKLVLCGLDISEEEHRIENKM